MTSAFVRRGPNPLYDFKTAPTKVLSGITKQSGDQNIIIKEDPDYIDRNFKPYVQDYKGDYKYNPVLPPKDQHPHTEYDKIMGRKAEITFTQDRDIFTGEPNSSTYIKQKVRTSGVGALGIFAEGNLENP